MNFKRLPLGPLPDEFAESLRSLTVNARTGSLHSSTPTAIESPFDGSTLGWVGTGTEEDVADAFTTARQVQRSWRASPFAERTRILLRYHDLVLTHRELLLDMIQLETGKNRASAFDEVMDVAINARYYGNHLASFLRPSRHPGALPIVTRSREYHYPKGVVGQISPWNYPLTLGISDALAAIAAGNTVVAKPDSSTPFCTLLALKLLLEAGLPAHVIQVVTGPGRVVGTAIADHCDYLMFTGSTATGKTLGEHVGRRLVGFSAELGGKNPMIVQADADLHRAVDGTIHGCFSNSGQLCVSIERIYVEEKIYDDYLHRLTDAVNAITLGTGLNWNYEMGSLASQQQLDTVTEFVDDARAHGATVVTGGRARPDLGPYFYEPTVLTDVPPEARLRREEVFGPVIYIDKVRNVEEALRRANDTTYGLNASIFGDPRTAWDIAPRIEAGSININDGYTATWGSVDTALGGVKESGMSRRHGREGLMKYTETQNIAEQRIMPIQGPPALGRKAYSRIVSLALRAGKATKLLR
ncbi:succinic semialdehyde dehydrogenase [Corynebacterium kroppenstedtii]|uniref:succinic semialdehyde dehydrogenase n=1 Tax=Corynebacterium sp. PCR 32 TaxID=3351342 RepID=UPI0030AA5A1F